MNIKRTIFVMLALLLVGFVFWAIYGKKICTLLMARKYDRKIYDDKGFQAKFGACSISDIDFNKKLPYGGQQSCEVGMLQSTLNTQYGQNLTINGLFNDATLTALQKISSLPFLAIPDGFTLKEIYASLKH